MPLHICTESPEAQDAYEEISVALTACATLIYLDSTERAAADIWHRWSPIATSRVLFEPDSDEVSFQENFLDAIMGYQEACGDGDVSWLSVALIDDQRRDTYRDHLQVKQCRITLPTTPCKVAAEGEGKCLVHRPASPP